MNGTTTRVAFLPVCVLLALSCSALSCSPCQAASKPHIIFVMADDLESDPREANDLSSEQPDRFERMKRELLTWNETVDASFAGKDYPEGRVTPADPEPQFWFDTPAYAPYVPEWKDRWEFKSYFERRNKPEKAPRVKR